MSSTQTAESDCKCSESSRPTISALCSVAATVQGAEREVRNRKFGPSYGSNPHAPRIVPVTCPSRLRPSAVWVSIRRPPLEGSALAGSLISFPSFPGRYKAKSCPMSDENKSGAPSTGNTSDDFCKQKTESALTARNGGSCAASTKGSPTTITDIGLRNDGGLLSLRFICSFLGRASAGM